MLKKVFLITILVVLLTNLSFGQSSSKKIVYSIFLYGDDSIHIYTALTKYINEKLKTTYLADFEQNAKISAQMVGYKEASFGFLCSGPYTIYREQYNLVPIAAIKPAYGRFYGSYIFVPVTSPAKTLMDLKGKTFSITYLESFTGRLIVYGMIKNLKENPSTFFSKVIYSKTHDKSVYNVLEGAVDGGSSMSLVVDYLITKDPTLIKKIKIIHKSPSFAPPIFVASKYLSHSEKEDLKKVLLNMHNDPNGKALLHEMQIEKFYNPSESEYDSIKQFINNVREFIP